MSTNERIILSTLSSCTNIISVNCTTHKVRLLYPFYTQVNWGLWSPELALEELGLKPSFSHSESSLLPITQYTTLENKYVQNKAWRNLLSGEGFPNRGIRAYCRLQASLWGQLESQWSSIPQQNHRYSDSGGHWIPEPFPLGTSWEST